MEMQQPDNELMIKVQVKENILSFRNQEVLV